MSVSKYPEVVLIQLGIGMYIKILVQYCTESQYSEEYSYSSSIHDTRFSRRGHFQSLCFVGQQWSFVGSHSIMWGTKMLCHHGQYALLSQRRQHSQPPPQHSTSTQSSLYCPPGLHIDRGKGEYCGGGRPTYNSRRKRRMTMGILYYRY